MNVTFHTLAALATAAVLSARRPARDPHQPAERNLLPTLALGFATGIVVHGLLDVLPHSYPIPSLVDVALSLVLFAATALLAKKKNRPLVGACFLGAIFPDLLDLGAAMLNKNLGSSLPVVKVFPWHWPKYSGSIYDGGHAAASLLLHLIVSGLSLALLYRFRKSLFADESGTKV